MVIEKQQCPNCGKMVEILVTNNDKKGLFNSCKYCIGRPVKSLQELNEERKKKQQTK